MSNLHNDDNLANSFQKEQQSTTTSNVCSQDNDACCPLPPPLLTTTCTTGTAVSTDSEQSDGMASTSTGSDGRRTDEDIQAIKRLIVAPHSLPMQLKQSSCALVQDNEAMAATTENTNHSSCNKCRKKDLDCYHDTATKRHAAAILELSSDELSYSDDDTGNTSRNDWVIDPFDHYQEHEQEEKQEEEEVDEEAPARTRFAGMQRKRPSLPGAYASSPGEDYSRRSEKVRYSSFLQASRARAGETAVGLVLHHDDDEEANIARMSPGSSHPVKGLQEQPPASPPCLTMVNLAVARLVDDDNDIDPMTSRIPKADEVCPKQKGDSTGHHSRLSTTPLVLFVIVVGAMVLTAVALALTKNNRGGGTVLDFVPRGNSSMTTTTAATSVPMGPLSGSSPRDYVMSLLPEYTLHAMNTNPDTSSPQFLAFEFMVADPLLDNYTDWRIMQRFALATLYHATIGPNWFHNDHWLSYNVHECDWFFQEEYLETITAISDYYTGEVLHHPKPCTRNNSHQNQENVQQQYQHIFLESNNLKGTLPREIFLLTHLRSIDFSRNGLTGSLSTLVGNLQWLETLRVPSNAMTGVLPTQLGLLQNLVNISLTRNSFESTLVSELGNLPLLERLVVDQNNFYGTIPKELSNLSNLQVLDVSENELTGTFPNWFNSSNFPHLKEIWLYDNEFNGTITEWVATLSNLRVFDAGNNNLIGTIPSWFNGSNFPKLEALFCDNNAYTGIIPSALGSLSVLKMFKAWNNQLTGQIPSELGLVSNVQALEIDTNQLTGKIPTELGVPSLEYLWLFGNMLTGAVPSELGLATNLLEFNVADMQLTGTIPSSLGSWNNLTLLNISNNPFLSGTVPDSICGVTDGNLALDCSGILCGCYCTCLSLVGTNNITSGNGV